MHLAKWSLLHCCLLSGIRVSVDILYTSHGNLGAASILLVIGMFPLKQLRSKYLFGY